MDQGAESYARYLAGDDTGMHELVCSYRDGLLLYLHGFTHDYHAAEDLAEDTFVRLAVKKPRFRGRSSFRTWLFAIARNLAVDALRRSAAHPAAPLEETLPDPDADAESVLLRDEQKRMLHRAVMELNPAYRQVLHLVYFEQFSNAETAQIMHKTKRQIENLLYSAKKALRTELERMGFEYEDL